MKKVLNHRLAEADDFNALIALQRRATLGLSGGHYDLDAMRLALEEVPILTRDLVDDGHYHVFTDPEGAIVAGGGWSCRAPGFAGAASGTASTLAPGQAFVRAVNVDPAVARQGLGRRIMTLIEADAAAQGIRHFLLTATLPGKPLYLGLDYRVLRPVEGRLSNGYLVRLFAMEKMLVPGAHPRPGSVTPDGFSQAEIADVSKQDGDFPEA